MPLSWPRGACRRAQRHRRDRPHPGGPGSLEIPLRGRRRAERAVRRGAGQHERERIRRALLSEGRADRGHVGSRTSIKVPIIVDMLYILLVSNRCQMCYK